MARGATHAARSAPYAARSGTTLADVALATVVGLIALAVFAPALANDFVDWDDVANFVTNPHYRGLGWVELRWMFSSALTGHWIPVTWITLGLDYLVWGMNPVGYHLTNLLLHALGTGLFFLVALRLLGLATPTYGRAQLRIGAAVAALFFAVHPLRAESVAWITERRDVLAGVFFLGTILAYLKACAAERRGSRLWHAAALGCYALALGSKAIVLSLPLILLILDVYPLRRLRCSGFTLHRLRCSGSTLHRLRCGDGAGAWSICLEKIPYMLLSMAAGITALWALRAASGLTSIDHHPVTTRLALALYGLGFSLWKTVVPSGLTPLYELPVEVRLLDAPFLASALAVTAFSAVLWRLRRRWPAALAAWVAYCAVLLPVSVRVHAGHQLVTDRYSYLACLGWALIVGGLAAALAAGSSRLVSPAIGRLAGVTIALWLAGLAGATSQQVQVWRDSETLWRHALDVDPNCANCYNHLGAALGQRGELGPAIELLERGLALRPEHGALTLNLVDALMLAGRWPEAVARLERILARFPSDNELRGRLAVALVNEGTLDAAATHVDWMIRSRPTSADALLNLGLALVMLARPREAIPYLERAAQASPLRADTHFWLARAHLAAGDPVGARAPIETLRRLNPRLAERLA